MSGENEADRMASYVVDPAATAAMANELTQAIAALRESADPAQRRYADTWMAARQGGPIERYAHLVVLVEAKLGRYGINREPDQKCPLSCFYDYPDGAARGGPRVRLGDRESGYVPDRAELFFELGKELTDEDALEYVSGAVESMEAARAAWRNAGR